MPVKRCVKKPERRPNYDAACAASAMNRQVAAELLEACESMFMLLTETRGVEQGTLFRGTLMERHAREAIAKAQRALA